MLSCLQQIGDRRGPLRLKAWSSTSLGKEKTGGDQLVTGFFERLSFAPIEELHGCAPDSSIKLEHGPENSRFIDWQEKNPQPFPNYFFFFKERVCV